MERKELFRTFFVIIAILGLILSVFLLKEHYASSGSSFCDFSSRINCDVVNKSPYASLFGIPIALLGLFYYLGILLFALIPERLAAVMTDGDGEFLSIIFAGYTLFGFIFSLYLTFIEAFLLGVWCPFCVCSALLATILFVTAVARAKY